MNDKNHLVTHPRRLASQDTDKPCVRRLSKATSMERLIISEASLGPGQRLAGPGPGRERFVYVLKGAADVQAGDASFSLETGDFLGFSAADPGFELGNRAIDDLIYLQGQAPWVRPADDDP